MAAHAQALADAILAYTGLSPAAAFTILALMVATYLLVSSLFVHPDCAPSAAPPQPAAAAPQPEAFVPLPEPVQLGEIAVEQLSAYDGKDPKKPLLIAIRGQVYDVSRGRFFYGPQGPYSLFAGRDATRALALMSFDPNDLTGDLEGLSPDELEVLQDWEEKFKERYPRVGHLASEHPTDSNQNSGQLENVEESRHETVNAAREVETGAADSDVRNS